MKILNVTPLRKINLPGTGKLNVRWRQQRAVWQIFAGRLYVPGASGDTQKKAVEELYRQYNVPIVAEIKTH